MATEEEGRCQRWRRREREREGGRDEGRLLLDVGLTDPPPLKSASSCPVGAAATRSYEEQTWGS
ncbi:hypothetical protein SORBI_3008G122250 [Sorghum bicolor]|uniref:Uncharacterized protein n=1 Tax=Sorghum bicolor TaxID=4558 RepID=A0A1Z5R753_SORBI|nr:hypothetical protein SORBI_3008G122250 [Sorghum bicolor]